MWIMVAGPYTAGGADTAQRAKNLQHLNEAAYQVFQKGHVPIIGVNMALPIVEAAPEGAFEQLMMPISLQLAQRCDAVLRIGGPSKGADQEVELVGGRGPIYHSVEQIPDDPGAMARAFRRVRYDYHRAFFEQLKQEVLRETFEELWSFCVLKASAAELDGHTPTVLGLSPQALAARLKSWSQAEQLRFWDALISTLSLEARGDEKRGRAILARKLHVAVEQLSRMRDAIDPITIRPFEDSAAERSSVIELWHRCDLVVPWNDPEKDIQTKLATQPELFLVGLSKRKVLATAMGGYDGHRGWVYYLAVSPERQGQGLGRRMMIELQRRLKAMGCPKLNLQVRTRNAKVIQYYEHIGFEVDEVVSLGRRLDGVTKPPGSGQAPVGSS